MPFEAFEKTLLKIDHFNLKKKKFEEIVKFRKKS